MSDGDQAEVFYDTEIEERVTELARLFMFDGDEVWIPKSQIADEESDRNGDGGTLWIPEWLAIEKGLE
ncbi:hypothetical protein LCGC14_1243370 [marine sediment metagenome]|uniref:Uncharacterized protein n=1 Tax=marine sediment metagenome TaxID=412755 RepID=A0A0F9LSB5_9ZZZZ